MVLKHLVTKVKLKIKFNIIFLVFLAAIIIGGYFCYLIVSEYIISLYSDNMKNIIKQNSRNIEMKYEELNDRIYDISRNYKVGELLRQRKYEENPVITANIDSKISKEISELINTKNDFLNIFILTKDNKALISKNEEIISKDEFLKCDEITEYFKIKKESIINPVLIDNRKVSNKVIKRYFPRAVTLFYDIRPPSSIKNEGTMVCYIYDKVFLSILNDIDIGKDSEVFVIGKKGNIVFEPKNTEHTGTVIKEKYIQEILKRRDLDTANYLKENVVIGNIKYLVVFGKIEKTDWTIVGLIPVEELLGKLINARNMFFLIGLIVGIIFLMVNFIIANDIVNNINTLMVAMQKVAKGYLDAEYVTDRTDEIGILGSSFGVMKENLKNYNDHLKEMVEEKTNELVVLNKKLTEEKELTEKTNKGLHITMETLKETQKKLLVFEKMASLGKFAGGIAHEINSPLVGIITGTDLLMVEIEELNEENLKETKDSLKENITIISQSAKKSKDIILKLLKYSEKEEKKISEVSIKDTFEYLIDTLEDEINKKNIVIAHEISEQLFVNGIKEDLITAFRNIIENSIYGLSHSEKEIKRINIYEDKNLKYKNIVIEDNGIGIEKNNINSVFDPFFTTKKVGEGMGLGLTVTYQIIMKHNFNIFVESVPNKWTKVIIDIS